MAARVVVLGVHPVADQLRALIEADRDLAGCTRAWWAHFRVEVRSTSAGRICLHCGQELTDAEFHAMAMLDRGVRSIAPVSTRSHAVTPRARIVLDVPATLDPQARHRVAHALYRALLRAAHIAPPRDTPRAPWWRRPFSRATGAIR